ncbi:hypothetical protein JG687_00015728 [Phytophthora cactorum]|uniref:Uncharacterized protein n=1 Tax=Phytophthora cactorum TaxID=29920 RepID=A0A8T1TVI1_9STRA|nr:hypothetical protein JG687_00015728 [Phytophthora cactorum]
MRQIDAFIKFALIMDPITRIRLPFRGLLLFGDVKTYFGMVETQFLIRLNRCPPNSVVVESLLEGAGSESFREQVASYAASIVQNNRPISIDSCG